jgi:predicted AAA+ superfamily ATPase
MELLAHRTGTLLNVSELATVLGHTRPTTERYLAAMEKLFLIRRLPAWHRNAGKRLVKTPKVHLCDSGLAAVLSDLAAEGWVRERQRFGHLLESFVLQQLIAEAGWSDPDFRFWHYRDKDQVEVDCVITRGACVWGVEVKSAATVDAADARGLRRLAEQAGSAFASGIVFYAGSDILPLGDPRLLAVPLAKLWERPA